jgi:hypothetical protein
MPNTHVPAAGEAMPAAKPTAIIGRFSRRSLLNLTGAGLALAATAMATVKPSPAAPVSKMAERDRLAVHLAKETGISEAQAQDLIGMLGTDRNSLLREARLIYGQRLR